LGPAEEQNAVGVAGTRVYKLPDRAGSTAACFFVGAVQWESVKLVPPSIDAFTREFIVHRGTGQTGLCHLLFGGGPVILGFLPVSLLEGVVRSAVKLSAASQSFPLSNSAFAFLASVDIDSNSSSPPVTHFLWCI
jgi:hypothetical protein